MTGSISHRRAGARWAWIVAVLAIPGACMGAAWLVKRSLGTTVLRSESAGFLVILILLVAAARAVLGRRWRIRAGLRKPRAIVNATLLGLSTLAVIAILARPLAPDRLGAAVVVERMLTSAWEELLFRGLVLPLLLLGYQRAASVLICALLFALLHVAVAALGGSWGSAWMTVSIAFAGGVVLGALRVRTGSLAAPLLVHLGWNLLASMSARGVEHSYQPFELALAGGAMILLTVGCAAPRRTVAASLRVVSVGLAVGLVVLLADASRAERGAQMPLAASEALTRALTLTSDWTGRTEVPDEVRIARERLTRDDAISFLVEIAGSSESPSCFAAQDLLRDLAGFEVKAWLSRGPSPETQRTLFEGLLALARYPGIPGMKFRTTLIRYVPAVAAESPETGQWMAESLVQRFSTDSKEDVHAYAQAIVLAGLDLERYRSILRDGLRSARPHERHASAYVLSHMHRDANAEELARVIRMWIRDDPDDGLAKTAIERLR